TIEDAAANRRAVSGQFAVADGERARVGDGAAEVEGYVVREGAVTNREFAAVGDGATVSVQFRVGSVLRERAGLDRESPSILDGAATQCMVPREHARMDSGRATIIEDGAATIVDAGGRECEVTGECAVADSQRASVEDAGAGRGAGNEVGRECAVQNSER